MVLIYAGAAKTEFVTHFDGPLWYIAEMYLGTSISCLIPLSPALQALHTRFFGSKGGVEPSPFAEGPAREAGRERRLRNIWNDDSILKSTVISHATSVETGSTR